MIQNTSLTVLGAHKFCVCICNFWLVLPDPAPAKSAPGDASVAV
jgi:hypothetical protein